MKYLLSIITTLVLVSCNRQFSTPEQVGRFEVYRKRLLADPEILSIPMGWYPNGKNYVRDVMYLGLDNLVYKYKIGSSGVDEMLRAFETTADSIQVYRKKYLETNSYGP